MKWYLCLEVENCCGQIGCLDVMDENIHGRKIIFIL